MRVKNPFSTSSARLRKEGGRDFASASPSASATASPIVASDIKKSQRTPEELTLRGTRLRIEGTFYLLTFLLVGLAGRLVWLQASGEPPKKLEKPIVITANPRRADILARDGTALAVTLDEYTIVANPRAIKEKDKMARLIAQSVNGNEQEIRALLGKTERGTDAEGKPQPNYYVRLAKRVSKAQLDKIKKLRSTAAIKGVKPLTKNAKRLRREFWAPISWEATPRRHYPLDEAACQLIGYTLPNGKGVTGLEAAWNSELSGKPEVVKSQVDSTKRPVPMFISDWKPPVQGHTIVTTIDRQIQAACDDALARMLRQYKPQLATAIVLDPRTGEVLAMSSAPTFDLNQPDVTSGALTSNRCLQYAYEPGSTFKIITASAAVETVPDWRNHSFFCAGSQQVGGHNMHCWISSTSKRQHGQETLSDSIRDSCNFGVYGFARLAGRQTMYDYTRRFGLGKRIGMAQLRDHGGFVPKNPTQWGDAQFANFSFGQGMMITPMQLVRVAGTIANKGVMMKPLLIKETRDEKGNIIKRVTPQPDNSTMPNGQIIKPETAEEVRKMMERVTTEGTAKKFVFVPGYSTAGKTGSAQKVVKGERGYSSSKFISSLVGFVPAKNPRFVILVMADEPQGSHWGSEVCGPAFADIATESMRLLRLREGTSAPAPNPALMERRVAKAE